MAETLSIRNESMVRANARLTIDLDADFSDVLRAPPDTPGPLIEVAWAAAESRLEMRGSRRHAGREDVRGIGVTMDPPPDAVETIDESPTARRLAFDIELEPRGGRTIQMTFESLADGAWRTPDQAAPRRLAAEAWRARRTAVETTEALVGPAVERAADDLLALRAWELEPSDDGSAWVANAGVPWFTGFFGRDALTCGWQAALLGVEPLRGALEVAARSQGARDDPWTEEQPGRMVHEMRRGPIAMLGVRPHRGYYGSQTTGSMFLLGLTEAWHWTGDDELLRRHRDAALRTIDWAESLGDPDSDGFLEYARQSPDGLKNQGWKDSDEAIRYPDGTIVDDPISTVEEQAFHYLALQRMAEVLVALEESSDRAEALLRRAAALRDAWHRAFWMPEEGYYALALDPDERQVRTISSNVGHALGTGIVPSAHAVAVADRLLADDMFSGWGIRTLSSAEKAYNPISYHLGTVWPHDNALIAAGFERYGLDEVRRWYFEVWNEPNLHAEWDTGRPVNPTEYAEMLKVAYTRAKEANPDIIVLAAPLATTKESLAYDGNLNELDYMQGLYDAGAQGYFALPQRYPERLAALAVTEGDQPFEPVHLPSSWQDLLPCLAQSFIYLVGRALENTHPRVHGMPPFRPASPTRANTFHSKHDAIY